MSYSVTVVVVDDHPLFRRGVIEALGAREGVEVVGQAADAAEAVQQVKTHLPDVVVLDLGIPGDGLEVARMVATLSPATRVVILTASESEDSLAQALGAGVKGYVVKGVSAEELTSVVWGVAHGEAYVSPSLAANVLMSGKRSRFGAQSDPVGELTDREQEVLDLIAEAFSNKEIAARLEISEKTVKHHVTNILDKLQARNRVEAALLARRRRAGSLEE